MRVRTLPPHGDRSRYARGCRCPNCREASRLYHKRLRENRLPAGRVNSAGTQRRLQALHRTGWAWPYLAAHLDATERWPAMLANQPPPTVTRGTARLVAELYDRLSHQPGPSARARTWAAKHGWHPPLAWDDDIDDPAARPWTDTGTDLCVDMVAVDRALRGHRVALTRLERHHAVHEGRRRGMGLYEVAEVLRMSYTSAKKAAHRPLPAAEVAA